MILIVDLDNTLYSAKSLDPSVFEPAISMLRNYYASRYNPRIVDHIMNSFWSRPVDTIFEYYETPKSVIQAFREKLDALDFDLEIETFPDYASLANIECPKYLVTTGFAKLQNAKIDALKIRSDFDGIIIDDVIDDRRLSRQGILERIIQECGAEPDEIWLIGENPESELLPGRDLGMRTIQRLHMGGRQSEYADHAIRSFDELRNILS